MSAFPSSPLSNSLNYLRAIASQNGCNPCFDGLTDEVLAMNDKGSNGRLACLCKIGTMCPCDEFLKEGKCYCEIFRKL
jgi:hypothetical protein